MEKKIKLFLDDMFRFSHETDYFAFFYKSKVHVMINLILCTEKKYTYEELCNEITPKFASRSTLQSILKEGFDKKYFDKKINEKDKREKFYKLNNFTKKKLNMWVDRQKFIFKS